MYNKLVQEYFFHPQHVGEVRTQNHHTVSFNNISFNLSAAIALSLSINERCEIMEIRYKTNGNPYLIAVLEWLCRQSIAKKSSELSFNLKDLITVLAVPPSQVPVVIQALDVYDEVLKLLKIKVEGQL